MAQRKGIRYCRTKTGSGIILPGHNLQWKLRRVLSPDPPPVEEPEGSERQQQSGSTDQGTPETDPPSVHSFLALHVPKTEELIVGGNRRAGSTGPTTTYPSAGRTRKWSRSLQTINSAFNTGQRTLSTVHRSKSESVLMVGTSQFR